MGEVEALGDVVTGGVLGRAVEPRAGEASDGHTHERSCLNCGAALTGPYCHQCGQHAQVHRTLRAFFHDFLHGVLHFEGKIWRTLPMLAWQPGELTRNYIDGQRARFVSPIALFLFSVFLMFAVIGLTGTSDPNLDGSSRDLATQQRSAEADLAELQDKRAELLAQHQATAAIDDSLRDARSEVDLVRNMRRHGVTSAVLGSDKSTIQSSLPWVKDVFYKARENPELLFYKIKTNAYKFSWALIPISIPFVWLLFPLSRRFKLYDHIVFVTYSLSFMLLLLVAGTLVALVSAGIASLLWFVSPIHMFRQLRGTYALGKWGAAWRTVVLVVFAFVAIGLFALLLIALGAFE